MPTINTTTDTLKKLTAPVRKSFRDWLLRDAQQAIEFVKERRVGREGFDANWAYAQDKNHYQNGDGWVGPIGGEAISTRARVKENVTRQFTPVDTIGEVLDNLANSLLQNQATVTLETDQMPADPQSQEAQALRAEIAGLVGILTRWAQDRRFWEKTRDAVKRARWATWGTLRTWIPTPEPADEPVDGQPQAAPAEAPDQAEQQTTVSLPTGLTLEEALDRVHLSAPLPNQGFVYTDPDTQRTCAIFLYADAETEFVELCWLDDAGQTVFRMLSSTGDDDTVTHDLGGWLPLSQIEGELLITGPVRMQQAQLNFASSVLTRVMELAGFAERYIIDGEPEGEWSLTAPSEGDEPAVTQIVNGVTWYLRPTERTLGANISTEIRAMVDEGPNKQQIPRSPQVIKFEPTDPDYIIKARRDCRATILRQCKQGHLEIDGEATASGWSRVQARAAHLADVTNMREALATLIRDTFEVALRYAALMSPEAAQVLTRFRVGVAVHINLGPVSPEERTAILEMMKAGALSLPSALTLLQVEDVEGEIERIRSQPESQQAMLKAQAELGGVFVREWGLDAAVAAKLAGMPPDMVALIQRAAAVEEQREDEQRAAGEVPVVPGEEQDREAAA